MKKRREKKKQISERLQKMVGFGQGCTVNCGYVVPVVR